MDKKFVEMRIREIRMLLDEIESEISFQKSNGELSINQKIDAILKVQTISENTKRFISGVKAFVDSGKTPSPKQVDCVNQTYDTLF